MVRPLSRLWSYNFYARYTPTGDNITTFCSNVCQMPVQWVDDHTHMPTLERLPKHIPIVAQPEAAQRIKPLGFKSLTPISHGQNIPVCGGRLQVTATVGALMGTSWLLRQNGYVLRVGDALGLLTCCHNNTVFLDPSPLTCLQWDTTLCCGWQPGMEPLLEWCESAKLAPGSQ